MAAKIEERAERKFVSHFLLMAALFLLFSVLADKSLVLLGFPGEVREKYAHPSNYHETRRNIEFQYEFKTNSQGLRYQEIPLAKPPEFYRVFVAGDSLTEGEGNHEKERFTALLEDEFSTAAKEVRFINGGLSGTGPLEYGRIFFNVGIKYQPDLLLVCLSSNDLSNTPVYVPPEYFSRNYYHELAPERKGAGRIIHILWPRTETVLRTFLTEYKYRKRTQTTDFVATVSRAASAKGIPQERIDEWTRRLPEELVAGVNRGEFNGSILSYGLFTPQYWRESIDIHSAEAQQKWSAMTRILDEISRESKRRGISVAMLYIPDPMQYDPARHDAGTENPWRVSGAVIREEWLSEDTEIRRRLHQWTQEQATPFLDLTPAFRAAIQEGQSLNYKLDGHLNPKGHKVAAAAISNWLKENTLIQAGDSA